MSVLRCSRFLSPVAVIFEPGGASLTAGGSHSFSLPNYIAIIKMLIQSVKGAIKRVIKKALFNQSTCNDTRTDAARVLVFPGLIPNPSSPGCY